MPNFSNDTEMYRHASSLIDIISFDYAHLMKDMRILSCVVLYIVIGLKLSCFTMNEVRELPSVNENNIEYYQEFNGVFNGFLVKELGIELISFGEHFCYVCLFFCCLNEIKERGDKPEDGSHHNDERTIRMQDCSQSKSKICKMIEERRVKSA